MFNPDQSRLAEINRQLDELAAAYTQAVAPLRLERDRIRSRLRMQKMRAKNTQGN